MSDADRAVDLMLRIARDLQSEPLGLVDFWVTLRDLCLEVDLPTWFIDDAEVWLSANGKTLADIAGLSARELLALRRALG